MKYTLMHKRIPVVDMEIDDAFGAVTKIGKVHSMERIPLGISVNNDIVDRVSLGKWWIGRSIPASRSGLREALEVMDISSPLFLLTKCYGLSLSDQYWIKPHGSDLEWDKINFFDNPFSEDVGNILFGKDADISSLDLNSPDNTSDGWLKKKWKIMNGKRCLIKGGSNPAQQEPFNELLATAVMKRLNIPHIPYSLMWDDGLPYSVCEDFITSDTELISAWHILNSQKKANHLSQYQHFINCCESLGIKDAVQSLDQMLTVDFIIANKDRHFNNFGIIRNAETLKCEGFAPIYDSGTSMWHDKFTNAIANDNDVESKPFKEKHNEQIKLVTSFDWLDFDALDGIADEFAEILSASSFIDDERCAALCIALENRTRQIEIIAQSFSQNLGMDMQ